MESRKMTLEQHREFWAKIAKENGWYKEPFYIQVWTASDGKIVDSVAAKTMTQDVFVEHLDAEVFAIDGYWVDDKSPIEGELICAYDNTPDGYIDDDIFYYGLDRKAIEQAIATKEPIGGVFVITSFWACD